MMNNSSLREYSGYLIFPSLKNSLRNEIAELAKQYGVDIDVTNTALEFEFSGRDTNRFVETLLTQLAKILTTATGEIVCEHQQDGEDPVFFFYSIKGGELFRQEGRIVRQNEKVRLV